MSQISLLEREIPEVLQCAKKIFVTNNEQETFAVEFLKIIANGKKQVGEEFDEGVSDAHSLHKKLVAQRAKYLDVLKEADDIVRSLIKGYRLELEKKRKDDEAKAKAILDASIKATQDRLMKESELAKEEGNDDKSNQLAMESVSIEPGSCVVASAAVKQDGMSSKLVWKGKVIDQSILPKEFLTITVNQKAIDDFAKKNDNKIHIAGVEWYQDVDIKVRS